MFENRYPIFRRGSLIDKSSLDLLRDNPSEVLDLMYSEKKDGIIKGFDLVTDTERKEVSITGGIVKYKGNIYWMREKYTFPMPEKEGRYTVVLKLSSLIEERKSYVRKGELIISESEGAGKDEIEVTRFITRIGAELRNDYRNFKDLRRDFNLLEIINTKYASCDEEGTLHPMMLKLWGLEASRKENLHISDIAFYIACLQHEIIERKVIESYVNMKTGSMRRSYTNEELYQGLLEILENLGNERRIPENKKIIPKKITIE